MKNNWSHIIISRPDSIGDVMLTLPMCGWIKKHHPEIKITFLGRSYTEEIIRCCDHVDHFLNWDDLEDTEEKKEVLSLGFDAIIHAFPLKEIVQLAHWAKIPNRIATGKRRHTLLHCNHRIWFSRKKSNLHESQLNLKLLKPLGYTKDIDLNEIPSLYGFNNVQDLNTSIEKLFISNKKSIILHTKSKGSAVEWPLDKFNELIGLLDPEKYQVFISGTEQEGLLIRDQIKWRKHVIDVTGKMSLQEFISFIKSADLIVAGSTGPLHIAAALGISTVGLYSPSRPIFPQRWKPIGKRATYLENDERVTRGVLSIPAKTVHLRIETLLLDSSAGH